MSFLGQVTYLEGEGSSWPRRDMMLMRVLMPDKGMGQKTDLNTCEHMAINLIGLKSSISELQANGSASGTG